MEIRYWAGTDVGRKRSVNEDNYLIDKDLKLFIVADGMGGHASGEVASAIAVHTVRDVVAAERDILDTYDDDDPRSHVEVCTLLEYAVHKACQEIHAKAQQEPEKRGMGTTIVVLLVIGARGFIAYVGDSRLYLLRGGIVYQLTEDHSLKNELIRLGKIRADEFEDSPYANLKNAMTRAVGVYDYVEVDTLDFDIISGDAFLLCSDGLYEYLDDNDISGALERREIKEVPGQLIELANTRGGKDNITGIVIQVAGDDDGSRAAEHNFTLDTLKSVPLFRALNYKQLVRILNISRQRTMEPGAVMFREGDQGEELFVILRGRIELTKRDVRLAELEAGAHLGEMALIDASPRSTTAIALEPGKLLSISRYDFQEIMHKEPPLAVKLLWGFVGVLSQRLRTTTAELTDVRSTQVPDMTDELHLAPETESDDEDGPVVAEQAPPPEREASPASAPSQAPDVPQAPTPPPAPSQVPDVPQAPTPTPPSDAPQASAPAQPARPPQAPAPTPPSEAPQKAEAPSVPEPAPVPEPPQVAAPPPVSAPPQVPPPPAATQGRPPRPGQDAQAPPRAEPRTEPPESPQTQRVPSVPETTDA